MIKNISGVVCVAITVIMVLFLMLKRIMKISVVECFIIMVLFLMLKRIMKILGVVCHHHGALANAHEDHEDLWRE